MMKIITQSSSIDRKALYSKQYTGVSKIISQDKCNEDMESYYHPLAKLLALIYDTNKEELDETKEKGCCI